LEPEEPATTTVGDGDEFYPDAAPARKTSDSLSRVSATAAAVPAAAAGAADGAAPAAASPPPVPGAALPGKWRNLWLLVGSVLFAKGLWFSVSAVTPQLRVAWGLDASAASWLTIAVQAGFVAGALVSAATNLADRVAPVRLLALSAAAAALANGLLALVVDSLAPALLLRFLTGAFLAGVYPPGMKLVASWTERDRGLGIGLLVGALTIGSASPHLFAVLPIAAGGTGSWRGVLLVASGLALLGAAVAGLLVRAGPLLPPARRFDWRYATRVLAEPASRLANLGYLGHMWELYAVWTWLPLALLASYSDHGLGETAARLAGFAAVAVGSLGSVAAGLLADRLGRTAITTASLVVSGACCLLAGALYGAPTAFTVLALVWGFAVVADSAQFSAAVSELADREHVGTALTVQTCLGFLLTTATIWLLAPLSSELGWRWAFVALAPGPALGAMAMLRLRHRPESLRMAGGRR
jgi:MFS family permease